MEMKLDELLASISLSVQQAGQIVDRDAADVFLKLAASTIEMTAEKGGSREIPVAALMHHKPLLLDEVSIRMNASLRLENGSVYVETMPSVAEGDSGSETNGTKKQAEIMLTYKSSEPSEGIARITNDLNRNL